MGRADKFGETRAVCETVQGLMAELSQRDYDTAFEVLQLLERAIRSGSVDGLRDTLHVSFSQQADQMSRVVSTSQVPCADQTVQFKFTQTQRKRTALRRKTKKEDRTKSLVNTKENAKMGKKIKNDKKDKLVNKSNSKPPATLCEEGGQRCICAAETLLWPSYSYYTAASSVSIYLSIGREVYLLI